MSSSITGNESKPTPEELKAKAEEERMSRLEQEFVANKDNITGGSDRSGKEGFHRCYNSGCENYREDFPIGIECQCAKGKSRAPGGGPSVMFG